MPPEDPDTGRAPTAPVPDPSKAATPPTTKPFPSNGFSDTEGEPDIDLVSGDGAESEY